MAEKTHFFRVLMAFLLVFSVAFIYAGGQEETAEEPEVEGWDAIYEAAKQEGKVVVYSLSSRIFDAVETFKEAYPGIEVEAYDMESVDQIEKLTREQTAGIYNADFLFLTGAITLIKELLPQGLIVNYVPNTLLGGQRAEDVMPEEFREPLLTHSLESQVFFYNFETSPECPIDTLWDLTRPEWRGRVQIKDPLLAVENMNFLQMVVKYEKDMAAAYEQEFGETIQLSPGVPNAGYEWIVRLVNNDLVLTTSHGDAAKAVGKAGQTKPPLALSASSKLRYNEDKGTKLAIGLNIQPKTGLTKRNFLALANQAPHPNAAKLLIQWLLGDSQGGAGMTQWNIPGQWPSRSDVPPVASPKLEEILETTWFLDPDWIYEHGLEVRDFWLTL